MLGGAGAAPSGGASAPAASSAQSESAAISKGIKMAMTSVKPLMDKYVATARALTDKYTKLQAQYKEAKAENEQCATEEQIQKRIDVAVRAAREKAEAEE